LHRYLWMNGTSIWACLTIRLKW